MAAIIGGGLALAGGVLKGAGSKKAGNEAAKAAGAAAQTQKEMYLQTRADLQPFTQAGAGVLPGLNALAMSGPTGGGPDYVAQAAGERPLQMTQANLEATPGYQFDLSQGLKATQSAAAARGLGVSGASLKGAATYATNLADKTYQNQFALQQTRFKDLLDLNTGQQGQLQNQYARLHDTAALGANAAAQLGTQGTSLANQMGQGQITQGTALAQGTKGLTDALGNPLTDIGGSFIQRSLNPNPLNTGYEPTGTGSALDTTRYA
jgi:hypothetical protein